MDTMTDAPALTPQDVRALRNADSVSFQWSVRHEQEITDGVANYHYITATLSGRNSDTGYDQRHYVLLDPAQCRIEDYGEKFTSEHPKLKSCFASFGSAKFAPHLVTALGVLRPGDRLGLRWIAGNNSQTLDKVEYCLDEVYLRVLRGTKPREYMLDSQVSPWNSPARMCRKVDW